MTSDWQQRSLTSFEVPLTLDDLNRIHIRAIYTGGMYMTKETGFEDTRKGLWDCSGCLIETSIPTPLAYTLEPSPCWRCYVRAHVLEQ